MSDDKKPEECNVGSDTFPVAIAIRTAETATEKRMLITIRAGTGAEKITFNFGNYGSGGIQTMGGGPGDPPPCP